ncbi:hypothetical protein P879_00895 [Paragonimus westermani]|uniref:Protein kinase domain-containing protein n=1 Tax=Paragonimus westermani TaxID=34504 RepID=A0A8T0DV64_9TREM|nr:hypothetical protein P879_00895 [Paragonimus westermani]
MNSRHFQAKGFGNFENDNCCARAVVQARIQQALTASFVLICQPGPNSFVLVPKGHPIDCPHHSRAMSSKHSDSPTERHISGRRQRFHVIIGPQLCSCLNDVKLDSECEPICKCQQGRTLACANLPPEPCIHILFVMLRVLSVDPDDACVLQIPLPTSKAESLIQSYLKVKHTLLDCPKSEEGRSSPFTDNEVHSSDAVPTTKVCSRSPDVPLAIPKAVYPLRPMSAVSSSKTPHLLAIVNATVKNSSDCCELSNLTKGIKPVSRRGAGSVGAVMEVAEESASNVTASRTSSSDSSESARLRLSKTVDAEKYCTDSGHSSVSRRPRTAPQPEPPPRPGRGRTRSIRHACSTTFRPIRDCSPLGESKLSPIQSGDTSTIASLKQFADVDGHGTYESLCPSKGVLKESFVQTVVRSSHDQAPNFMHGHHSPFKPLPNSITLTHDRLPIPSKMNDSHKETAAAGPLNVPTNRGGNCALCLQPFASHGNEEDKTVRCCAVDGHQRCLAIFHLSCCQIWLEEISCEGDTPYCPVCLNRWEAVPFTCEIRTDCFLSETQDVEQNPRLGCRCDSHHTRTPSPETPAERHPESYTAADKSGSIIGPEHVNPRQLHKPFENLSASVSETQKVLKHQPQPNGPSSSALSLTVQPPYPEYKSCVVAFSLEIADGIASLHSAARRQWALQHAAQLTVHRILLARHHHRTSQSQPTIVGGTGQEDVCSRDHRVRTKVGGTTGTSTSEPDCLRVMFRIIQYLFDDPVDAVFIDALRAFRELLGYLVCFNAETQIALQRAIGPILRRLLRFVGGLSVLWTLRDHTTKSKSSALEVHSPTAGLHMATSETTVATGLADRPKEPEIEGQDSSTESVTLGSPPVANLRDRANLALATLVELAKGQSGALAIGRDVGCANHCLAVCGLQHMARFVLSSAKFHATHLIGRLTLLDKLIRIDQSMLCPQTPIDTEFDQCSSATTLRLDQTNTNVVLQGTPADRLARRHLCSSLVFARRHLLPPAPNSEMVICFPHHYQLQPPGLWANFNVASSSTAANAGAFNPATPLATNSALASLYETQLRASRVARRLFLTAARALLTYTLRTPMENNPSPRFKHPTLYAAKEFCPRDFVEVEINRTEAPLAAWLRSKLAPVLYPNLVLGIENPLVPVRMTTSEVPSVPPRSSTQQPQCLVRLHTSQTLDNILHPKAPIPPSSPTRNRSTSPNGRHQNCIPDLTEKVGGPPVPPPRRNFSHHIVKGGSQKTKRPNEEHATQSPYVRLALEPAYDLVAISETGNYSSVSEWEDEEADGERDRKSQTSEHSESDAVLNEPTYGGRSLSSEAELQTEQAAVLRSALRRCSRSLRPLLPVPALSMVMDAFRSTQKLPSSDEYYESIDWIRGPILGHGAFSKCYQARDTRTGLLMAVKRIRLGGGAVFPVVADQVKAGRPHRTERLDKPHGTEGDAVHDKASDGCEHVRKTCGILTTGAATQLAEVQAEVDIMLRLNHPNVLRLFGAVCCAQRGLVDLFIEWMPGGSVTSLLQQYGAFNESVTLSYGVQVVRGLAYLHKFGILHRDLKGANLLVDNTGSVVRISDFGASARLSGEESVTGQFQGQVIGTFSFMAPEVFRGETYGRACDIWSVGCCLVEMLTGKPPWHDAKYTNRYALMFAIATSDSPPTYPSGVHEDVIAVLDACFARHARDRPTASKLLTFRAFVRLTEPQSHANDNQGRRAQLISVKCSRRESVSKCTTILSGSLSPTPVKPGPLGLPLPPNASVVENSGQQKRKLSLRKSTTRVA